MEWLAQLPEDLRTNEAFTGHEKIGDFAQSHLDMMGKVSEFDGKVTEHEGIVSDLNAKITNSIPKLTETSSDEDKAAYHLALGVPESADAYEFPKGEGIEHDDKMIEWARGMFHGASLNLEQANIMSQGWDQYQKSLGEAMVAADAEAETAADNALKEEWKADYDKNIKETERGYQAIEKIVPGFAEFLATKTSTGKAVGNTAEMLKFVHVIGKAVGDDLSISGLPPKGEDKGTGEFSDIYTVPNPAPAP